MTDEAAEDANSLPAIGKHFDAAHIGNTVLDMADATSTEINDLMRASRRLIPYLTDMNYTDTERQLAEREMRRLSKELDEKMACYKNITKSARNLKYDFVLNT